MDIVVIGGTRWSDEVNQPPQQAVRALAKRHRVFYVCRELQGSALRNLIRPVDERGRQAALRAVRGHTRFTQVDDSVWVAPLRGMASGAPMVYPEWRRRRLAGQLERWLACEAERWDMVSPVYWFYWWFFPELARAAPARTVYDIIDDHTAYASNERLKGANRSVEGLERQLLREVDHAFAVSSSLVERKGRGGVEISLLPNGISLDQARAALAVPARPQDLPGSDRPIVGYVGDVGPRFDWALVAELADRRPDWNFAVVGGERPASVAERGNLHVLPGRPYAEIMRCVREFDVAILPLRSTEFNRSVSSLKLLDYLAADKPVVATDLPFVHDISDRWDGVVSIAEGATAWEEAIRLWLSGPESRTAGAERGEAVSSRTVEARVEHVLRTIEAGVAQS